MIFRALDENHDFMWGKGKSDFLTGNAAIGMNIKTRILSWVGDCFFDQNAGIDWWNRLGSKNQRALLELDLKRIILQSEGVTGIVAFQTNLMGRRFSASYTVNTIYTGEIDDEIFIGETPTPVPPLVPNYVFDGVDLVYDGFDIVIDGYEA